MILEVAPLSVKVGQESKFEAAFRQAKRLNSAMPGFILLELQRCIERPNEYILLVVWQTLEDHEVGFPQVSGVPRMEEVASPLLRAIPCGFALPTRFGIAR